MLCVCTTAMPVLQVPKSANSLQTNYVFWTHITLLSVTGHAISMKKKAIIRTGIDSSYLIHSNKSAIIQESVVLNMDESMTILTRKC